MVPSGWFGGSGICCLITAGGLKDHDWTTGSHVRAVRSLTAPGRAVDRSGEDALTVGKQLEVCEQRQHRWRNQYVELKADYAKRLKELEVDKYHFAETAG